MEKQKTTIYKQILVAVIANISSAGFGIAIGWSSPNVPKLQDVTLRDTPLDRILTASEIGWIGSLVPIGGAVSPFFAGMIAAKFGRKSALQLSGLILLASFIILGIGQTIELIYVARFMHGICIGLTMTVIPMYIGEIAQDSLRGPLGTFMVLFLDTPFIAGTIADKFGRKPALLLSGIILCASYTLLGFGQRLELIYIARLMHGFCKGLTMTVMPMYLSEIAQETRRGALATFMIMFMDIGMLFSYSVGPFVPYATFQFMCLMFPVSFLILFPLMPETPTYHLLGGHKEKAIKSLMFLRNTTEDNVLTELDVIQRTINDKSTGSWKQLVLDRGSRRALMIVCGVVVTMQLSGISAVVYYSQSIFTRASTSISPAYASIITGCVPLIVDFCSPFTIERLGRKRNLIISAIGSGVGLALLTSYFFMIEKNVPFLKYLTFLPNISLIIYIAFFNIGLASVPWALVGELFTPDVKARASIVMILTITVCSAIILQFFELLNETIGPFWVFASFTVCTGLGLVFIIVFVFETKSSSLLEIQDKLNKVSTDKVQ